MPQVSKDFVKSKVVFVEGQDEVNVVESIAPAINADLESRDVGGKDKLKDQFPLAIKQSSFSIVTSFGIIQDANGDAGAAFDRVVAVLKENNFPAPNRPGGFVAQDKRRIGVLILPGGDRRGYLEDVFLEANAGTAYLNCADAFSGCCVAAGRAEFDSKERAYALLVALGAPETRLGRAFKSQRIDANHAAYDVLKNFLRDL